MKRNRSVIVMPIVLALICAALVSAQRTGGYREIAKDDGGAMAAADFAVKDQSEKEEMTYKLVSIEKAESQVVAGINYRLCLKVSYHTQEDEVDPTQFVQVVVFRSLQQEYSLTSWTEEACSKNGDPAVLTF